MSRSKIYGSLSRSFTCPWCGGRVTIPFLWMTGVESVFRCRQCKKGFGTGYKMGAVMFALAFVAAVATVNVACYLLGSGSMVVLFFAAFPLWFLYGYIFRRAWLVRRVKRRSRERKQ